MDSKSIIDKGAFKMKWTTVHHYIKACYVHLLLYHCYQRLYDYLPIQRNDEVHNVLQVSIYYYFVYKSTRTHIFPKNWKEKGPQTRWKQTALNYAHSSNTKSHRGADNSLNWKFYASCFHTIHVTFSKSIWWWWWYNGMVNM